MGKVVLPLNTTHTIVVNNGTAKSFVFNYDGTLLIPNNLYIGNTVNSYKAILNASNITTTDKTFTLNNRSGTLALEDLTSLLAMVPSLAGNNGKFLTTDGTTISWASVAAGGITSLNGLSTSVQTFAIGTSGTAVNWSSSGTVHTLNIPMASTASVTGGLLSNVDYQKIPFKDQSNTFNGTQTFTNAPIITNPGTSSNSVATYGQLLLARNGSGIRPPVVALDTVNTVLPTANPTIGGVVIAIGNRVLTTALTTGANKVYKATGTLASITWTLETDGQAGDGTPTDGDIVFVQSGGYADQQWAYNGSVWVLYNIASAYTFSTGLILAGTTVTIDFAASGVSSSTKAVRADDSRLSNSRTPTAHQLDSATHTISGKTAGQVLIATSATTYAFVTFSGDVSVSAAGAVVVSKLNSVSLNDLGVQQNAATLADNISSATLVTGCSWSIATYRAVKIEFTLTRGSGNYLIGSMVLLHDGTTPRLTYIEDDSIGTLGTIFSVDINGGNMRLLYTTTSTGTAVTMKFINYTFTV